MKIWKIVINDVTNVKYEVLVKTNEISAIKNPKMHDIVFF